MHHRHVTNIDTNHDMSAEEFIGQRKHVLKGVGNYVILFIFRK